MRTKFDVWDIVYLPVAVGHIEVTSKGDVRYNIAFKDADKLHCSTWVYEKDLKRKKELQNGTNNQTNP